MILLVISVVLLLVALGVQIWYARMILSSGVEVHVATKIVWGINIVLLSFLALGLGYLTVRIFMSGEM